MIFDSHAHYDSEQFDADRDEAIRRAREAGESKYTLKKMLKLALKGMECGRR